MGWENVSYDASAFVAGLVLLEFGAERFVKHTTVVARRVGVSQTLVALLTAGAEWEELVVVIACVLQQRSSLALGNVLGSSISNILGAFSLGLCFLPGCVEFDRSAKIYSAVLFVITTLAVVLAVLKCPLQIAGSILLSAFALYLASVSYSIYKGALEAPEESDDDSDSSDDEVDSPPRLAEHTPLLGHHDDDSHPRRQTRSLLHHISWLLVSVIALSISGNVLSHSAGSLADSFNLSGTVLGITILSFATTLPEKFVAVVSGAGGHGGIVVASTAGSNIFLLTLCLGLTYLTGDHQDLEASVGMFELLATWASSALFFLVVVVGARRWIGLIFLALYLTFIILEFSVFRR